MGIQKDVRIKFREIESEFYNLEAEIGRGSVSPNETYSKMREMRTNISNLEELVDGALDGIK